MVVALDHLGVGPTPDGKHHRPSASPGHGVGDRAGKAAAAADDRQRFASRLRVSHFIGSLGCIIAVLVRWPAGARPHQRTFAARPDEPDDLADQRIVGKLALHRIDPIRKPPPTKNRLR